MHLRCKVFWFYEDLNTHHCVLVHRLWNKTNEITKLLWTLFYGSYKCTFDGPDGSIARHKVACNMSRQFSSMDNSEAFLWFNTSISIAKLLQKDRLQIQSCFPMLVGFFNHRYVGGWLKRLCFQSCIWPKYSREGKKVVTQNTSPMLLSIC